MSVAAAPLPLVQARNAGPAPARARVHALDALRGVAVAAMICDHLAYLLAGPDVLRYTVGRLAVPLFFLLSGHLAQRVTWRHLRLACLGLALPVVVPWVDSPNVLLWLAVGGAVVAGLRRWPAALVAVIVAALTVAANGWADLLGTGYAPLQLLALMAAGALLPRAGLVRAGLLVPGRLAVHLGRHALLVYVAHLVALQGLLLLVG